MSAASPYTPPTWGEIVEEYLRRWPDESAQYAFVRDLLSADDAYRDRHGLGYEGSVRQQMDRSGCISSAHIPSTADGGSGAGMGGGGGGVTAYALKREAEARRLMEVGLPHVEEVRQVLTSKAAAGERAAYLRQLRDRVEVYLHRSKGKPTAGFAAFVEFVRTESMKAETPEVRTTGAREEHDGQLEQLERALDEAIGTLDLWSSRQMDRYVMGDPREARERMRRRVASAQRSILNHIARWAQSIEDRRERIVYLGEMRARSLRDSAAEDFEGGGPRTKLLEAVEKLLEAELAKGTEDEGEPDPATYRLHQAAEVKGGWLRYLEEHYGELGKTWKERRIELARRAATIGRPAPYSTDKSIAEAYNRVRRR